MGERGPVARASSGRYIGRKTGPPRTLADIPASELGTASMPKWLDKEARAFWRRHGPELARRGCLTKLDETMFALVCSAWSDLHRYDAILARQGAVIVGPRGGVRAHPLVRVRAMTHRNFIEGAKAFGLTPASRQRITAPPMPVPSETDDPMEAYLTRSARRAQWPDPRPTLTTEQAS